MENTLIERYEKAIESFKERGLVVVIEYVLHFGKININVLGLTKEGNYLAAYDIVSNLREGYIDIKEDKEFKDSIVLLDYISEKHNLNEAFSEKIDTEIDTFEDVFFKLNGHLKLLSEVTNIKLDYDDNPTYE